MSVNSPRAEKAYANLLELAEGIAVGAAFEVGPVTGDDNSQGSDSDPGAFGLGPVVGDDNGTTDDGSNSFSLGPVTGDDSSEPAPQSDFRLKADIEQVGTTNYGLPLYHFRYKSGTDRFEGVMAQEVLKVMPNAVSLESDGFYRVNYGMLGLRMRRI